MNSPAFQTRICREKESRLWRGKWNPSEEPRLVQPPRQCWDNDGTKYKPKEDPGEDAKGPANKVGMDEGAVDLIPLSKLPHSGLSELSFNQDTVQMLSE